jgi:DinB superfamily
MNEKRLIESLDANLSKITTLYHDVSPADALWRPEPEKWSLLEIIAHLYDEEREDFRARLDLLLHSPGVLGPPIDPEGWVKSRKYNEWDLVETLEKFTTERRKSLQWLGGLKSPDWENSLTHEAFGTIKAGDILGSWVAHDWLHIRQITYTQYHRVAEWSSPYPVGYAGDW